MTSSKQSSTKHSPVETTSQIAHLEAENNHLSERIEKIKSNEKAKHQKRILHLKKITLQHGYYLRKRINNLSLHLKNFLHHLQLRTKLWPYNTALLLEHEQKLLRQSILQDEKEKLTSTNKIHNFTDLNLPTDFVQLLNKGTNFIPTSEKNNIQSIKKTISSEVNSTLCKLITTSGTNKSLKAPRPSKTKSNHRYQPYCNKNPIKLLEQQQTKPNFNLHIIDYVHNTTSYTKHYLQSNNLHTLLKQQQLNITQPLTTYIQAINTRDDIVLTKTDKNMGWALVPTSWFTNEYNRHFTDTTTYKHIDNFDFTTTVINSNRLLRKLQLRFDKLITTPPLQTTTELYPPRQSTTTLHETSPQSTQTYYYSLSFKPRQTDWTTNYYCTQLDYL